MIYRKNTGKEEIKKLVKAGELTLAGCNASAKKSKTYGKIGTYNPSTGIYWVDCRGGRSLVVNTNKDESKSTQVFFRDEKDALSNGFRPCSICFPSLYAEWNSAEDQEAWRKKRLAKLG
jgi:hypothetical protein